MSAPGFEAPKYDLDPSYLLNSRPLAGRCVVELDQAPEMEGSLHLPETAQGIRIRDKAWPATVLRMTPRQDFTEDFEVGDKVFVLLALADIRVSHRIICTLNSRVYARQKRAGEDGAD